MSKTVSKYELVLMDWKCISCRKVFKGPIERAPKNGCPHCGSRKIVDINLVPIGNGSPHLS